MKIQTEKRYLLAEQTIDSEDLKDLIQWLNTNPWLTQGELVKKFEKTWSQWIDSPFSVFVNSGSSANLVMYDSLLLSGKLRNKKVIVPAVSWATTIAPAIQLGFEPILCEADRETFGLDIEHLELLLKKHDPGAVVLVHVLGVPNRMEEILLLKKRYGFVLMEDSCAATGSRYDGKHVGTFGEVSTFSFFYGHHLSTIEGGMVCTNDEKLCDLLLMIRSHGWGKDLPSEKEEKLFREYDGLEFNRPFTFYYPGFNVRSTDLNARIGLSQMRKADNVVKRRIENHKIYQENFMNAPGFQCQQNKRAVICSISFCALASSKEHRDRIALVLKKNRIETRPLGGGNMSRQPFWRSHYSAVPLPFADRIHETSFHLPNHPGISPEEIQFICDTVLSVKP
ncbi:MAG: aminotransferase class I/II-fold pyridoxal phosphate-dependent enzyme [Candidatus Eremiobacteraeota bacterium]|jgi:CDP-6-deoxy-D-xylo-4-hexulose-3-dehydrase|nr:aminotransferase class I/II-fold pyridoxal phosphate-dependent enzyme [Candidatus Eremiobacteraeota bacterium]MCL5054629.1 aminotransferase class I/II-fold pyridoxal phosphate-dependent enzyme [Bacillota bacterium]